MGNSRHIFKFACSEKLPFSGNSKNPKIKEIKKVKLVSEDNTKEIEFQGSYFGSYYLFKPDGESNEKFQLFVHRTRDNDIGEEVYLSDPIDLKSIRAKVTLDNQCKYQVALSFGNNEWITLPRSSLSYTNYDNLKKYYNKDLSLSKSGGRDYVMHGQDEVCELALISAPICFGDNNNIKVAAVALNNGIDTRYLDGSRLAIKEGENNQLLIYLSDREGNPIDTSGRHVNEIQNYFNIILRSALLENSNIREVLPELEIDDNVNLDTRQLSCWINNASTIQKIATDEDFKNSVKDLLKSDPEFINSVKGERGPQGLPGEKGEDASPEEVAEELTTNSDKRYKISSAVKSLLNKDMKFKGEVRDLLKSDKGFRDSVKGDSGKNGESPPVGAVAQELIATKANELGQAILNVKHDDREILANNQVLQQGVAAQLMNDDNRNTLVTKVAGNQDLQNAVADNLKSDTDFKGSVADNSGLRNGVKDSLKNDESFQNYIAQELVTKKADDLGRAVINVKDDNTEVLVNNQVLQQGVAAKLMNDDNRNMLVTKVAGNENLQNAVAGNQDLQEGVAEKLRENPGSAKGPQGEKGDPGGSDVSVGSLFTLQKGKELSEDIYEANIVLNDKTIATLPKIGYYTLNDQLVVHNHVTREKVVIPAEFHYLKVVRLGSGFGDSDYKLTFCNVLGNEFFEYKKYDPEYSRVPDEYKFISLSHAKKEYNPNLSELISHQPLFFIKKGPAEPGSNKYAAAVFELTHNGKGKKMATLIDEFGYFDQNGMFKHCNYHEETKCRSYTSAEIDKEYQVTDADSEFYLTEHDNLIIHTIPEL